MLHHHLLLLRAIIKGLPLLLWELLLVLHILLWVVSHVSIWTTCVIEILLLWLLHILEVHELLPHHILHVLEIHLLVCMHLGILLLIKPRCLEVKAPIISLELHRCHVHWLEILLECSHVLHLHVLEVLHVLVDIDRLLLLHEVLWPILLLRELVGSLLDHRRGWSSCAWSGRLLRYSILLHSESNYVHCNCLVLLLGLLWGCRDLDTLGNVVCEWSWLFCERGWSGDRGLNNYRSLFL